MRGTEFFLKGCGLTCPTLPLSTNAVRKERAAASSSSQQVRDRQAAASRLAAKQVEADFKEEWKGWAGKTATLEKKLCASHTEVLS